MGKSLINLRFLLLSLISHTTNSLIDLLPPECECITRWAITEIDCSHSTINTLESFLSLHDFSCMETCYENIDCQQSFSLLTQFYQYCPLGSVSQDIISTYNINSTCDQCKTYNTHNDQYSNPCLSINCTHTPLIQSIDYIELYCNDNITTQCTTECQNNWDIISSHQRQCDSYPLDYLRDLDMTECNTDCNAHINDIDSMDASSKYTFDFMDSVCSNFYSNYTAFELIDIEKEIKLCFYGLNIQNPTQYDLICVDRQDTNDSGIISYNKMNHHKSNIFWSAYANAIDINIVWVLLCGAIVFFMQLGFALLEGGAVKAGNVQNIMFKNLMDCAICAIMYWIVGYCLAYGDSDSINANGFMGMENIVIEDEAWSHWFFQMSFACTASTIVSGAVAERFRLEPYFIYTIAVSSWIYPIVVHWVWSETGWLSPFNKNVLIFGGAIDFAGSSCVHMIGGFLGLCAAYFVGPRLERFDQSKAATRRKYYKELQHQFEFGHSVPFQVVGLLVLWFGFYGFNPGSTLQANYSMDLASKIAVNTTLSAASGGITSALLAKITLQTWHIPKLCNGILAALASITASCAVVSPEIAIVIGCVGSFAYFWVSKVVAYYMIDDPLDAFAVHGIGGMWGVLSAGLFATNESLKFANYPQSLYGDTHIGHRIAANLLLIFVVIAWSLGNGFVLFGVMHWFNILRVSEQMERTGIDVVEHGGSALNMRKTYSISVKKTLSNKKHHFRLPFQKYFGGNNEGRDEEEQKHDRNNSDTSDGNFANKIRESSLERRLHAVAESDEHGVFPT